MNKEEIMEIMTRLGVRRPLIILFMVFMLCLIMTLVASPAYGGTLMTKVLIGERSNTEPTYYLYSDKSFLVNGKPAANGQLGVNGCTAQLMPDGTLKLSGYNGPAIGLDEGNQADMNILLYQSNTITYEKKNSDIYGLENNRGGDINITGGKGTKLQINLKLTGTNSRIANGISCYGKINISGDTDISIRADSVGENVLRGMRATNSVNISGNASTKITLFGPATTGIYAGNGIKIDTENEVGIWSFGNGSSNVFAFNPSVTDAAVQLTKAKQLIHVGKTTSSTNYKVNYNLSKFAVSDKSAGPGFNQRTYRYGNAFILKVNNGSGSGSYLDTDPVTIIANLPDPNFMFKKWDGGGDNLAYLEGTFQTSAKATFLMRSNIELTATYKTTLFTLQPKGGITTSTGKGIPISWSLSNFEGAVKWARIMEKDGSEWKFYSDLISKITPSVKYTSNITSSSAGTKTFKLEYTFQGPGATYYRHYSDEFTMTWFDVNSVTVSPKTASVQKGTSRFFTAAVDTTFGNAGDQVTWSVIDKSTNKPPTNANTYINRYGELFVWLYEDAETLQITAVSKDDITKKASAIVKVTSTPVTKYIMNVIDGEGSGEYADGEIIIMTPNPPISKVFYQWVTTDMPLEDDADLKPDFSFTMPDKNIEIKATYKDKHLLLVDNKIPEVSYIGYGTVVTVVADTPAANRVFDKWISEDISIIPDLAGNTTYHFPMPDNKVTITPTYKEKVTNTTNLQLLWADEYKIDSNNYKMHRYTHLSPGFKPENKVYTLDLLKEYDGFSFHIVQDINKQNTTLMMDGVPKDLIYSGTYDDNIKYYWTEDLVRQGNTSVLIFTVTSKVGTESGTYKVTINWKDSSVEPIIDGSALPSGTVGTRYDQGISISGTNPIEWGLISGDLPNGLYLFPDPSRVNHIQGYPTKAGTYYFQVKAENVAGADIKTKSITILEKPFVPEKLTGTVLISGETKYDQTLTATVSADCNNTGNLSYKWIVTDGEDIETTAPGEAFDADDPTYLGKFLICEVTSSIQEGKIYGYSGIIEKRDSPPAPDNLIPISPTSLGGTNGKILGTTHSMEYADNIYFTDARVCTNQETTGLKAGTYYVRFRDTDGRYAGDYATIIVRDYAPGVTEANAEIWKAKMLLPDGLDAVQGRDTNILDMLRAIPGMPATGVTLSLGVISNANIASDGKITYSDSEVSGYVGVKINKSPGLEQIEMVMVIIPGTSIIYGDVDGDGDFDVADYGYMKLFLLGKITVFLGGERGMQAGNVDGIGTSPSVADYGYMKLRLLNKISKFPAEL